MAHNCIHDIAVDGTDPEQRREEYLQQLKTAEEVASTPA